MAGPDGLNKKKLINLCYFSISLSIVQIIFSVWSFEISEGISRNQKIIIGLNSFSNQRFNILAFCPILITLVFVSTTLLKISKLQ